MSAKNALNKFYVGQLKVLERLQKPRRKNQRPEFELTKKPCMKWLKENGFSMNVVEARAVYHPESGKYLRGQTDAGFADAVGCTPDGLAAAVEFKAPGALKRLKPHQRQWIAEKILKGAFACTVDSVALLSEIWFQFKNLRAIDPALAKDFLLARLPPEPKGSDGELDFTD